MAPDKVLKQYGGEILRMWVAMSDYQSDLKISDGILKQMAEQYRKIRNTGKILLGNVHELEEICSLDKMGVTDLWILDKAQKVFLEVDEAFKKAEEPSESLAVLIKGIDSNPVYLKLLDVLFNNGERGVEDSIPPYKELVKEIANKGIVCEDKVIKNFLTICNLLDITNMSDKDSVRIVKDYSTSKGIVSLVSK
jgi:hypothetical protein